MAWGAATPHQEVFQATPFQRPMDAAWALRHGGAVFLYERPELFQRPIEAACTLRREDCCKTATPAYRVSTAYGSGLYVAPVKVGFVGNGVTGVSTAYGSGLYVAPLPT